VVAPGKTLTLNAPTANSTGLLTIAGGTVVMNGVNLNDNVAVSNGATLLTNATGVTPFGDTILTINGAMVQINPYGAGAVVTANTLTIAGGATLRLDAQGGSDTQLTATTLTRSSQGALMLVPGSGATFGNTNNSDVRLLATTIFGVAAGTVGYAQMNNLSGSGTLTSGAGIFAPYVVALSSTTNSNADFVVYDPVAGFMPAVPASLLTNTFASSSSGSVISVTSGTLAPSGITDLFALETTASIAAGGTLRFRSNGGTDMGGLLLNGSGSAAPIIGANLSFMNTLGIAPVPGEGLVYVSGGYSSGTATLAGSIVANTFTKFGAGTLLLSGVNVLEGNFAVQQGVVRFGSAASAPLAGSLLLNDTATLDLAGGLTSIGNLGGTQGIITNLSSTAGTLAVLGGSNTTFFGNITDGAGTTKLVKMGGSTLTLGVFTAGNYLAGNNFYTGGTDIYSGTLTVQNPLGLGGANGTTPGAVSLYGGQLNLQSNGAGVNGTIVYGNPNTLGLNVNVNAPAAVYVDRVGANTGNAIQIGTLNIGNSTLTLTGGNNYRLKVAGATNLLGSAAVLNPTTAGPVALELAGVISDGGAGLALNKTGGGVLIVSGTANS
jgi:autotransporter-associated beta strand protein